MIEIDELEVEIDTSYEFDNIPKLKEEERKERERKEIEAALLEEQRLQDERGYLKIKPKPRNRFKSFSGKGRNSKFLMIKQLHLKRPL